MGDTSCHGYAADGLPVPQSDDSPGRIANASANLRWHLSVPSLTNRKANFTRQVHALFMTQYWSISITIPGECFTMENRTEKAVETKKEWTAPELKKVDVEDVTSHILNLGDISDDS
jgi:hypothetical protein